MTLEIEEKFDAITLDKLERLWSSPISDWEIVPVSPTSRRIFNTKRDNNVE
jgi:hypothetical protein